jgi:hypothetical protein
MSLEDFFCTRDGWNEKMLHEVSLVRKSTFVIAMANGAKISSLEKAWPDPLKPVSQQRMVKYKGVSMTERQMQILVKLKAKNKKTSV